MRCSYSAAARALAAVVALFFGASGAEAADCQSLAGKTFDDALIVETDVVAPPLTLTSLDPIAQRGVSIKAPFCRVRVIKPSADSNINFEVWLPPAPSWNGKYEGVGNGGFAGTVIYSPMEWALEGGYAVSGTDTGHSGVMTDSRWALGHPEKIVDFGWRGIHETATASKAIIDAYYGKAPAHSYFSGCSTGGRQALVEAQRFPNDYDGIVAGAPANYWPQLLATGAWIEQAVTAEPGNWVSPAKLAAVNKATLETCHGENGVLDDPGQCRFDPSSLLCKSGQSDICLTTPEVETLSKIYSGPRDAAGNSIYPGYPPGDETSWSLWIMGPSQSRGVGSLKYPFSTGFFRNLVFQKPDWNLESFSLSEDLAVAINLPAAQAVYAEDPDLSAFKASGGKLIQYHGWNDPAISALASIKYYESVAAKMGGVENIKSFYRVFLGTGMEHCGFGPGPNAIGGGFGLPSPSRDPEHDIVSALAHWVEDGMAPAEITATHYRDNDPGKEIVAQRPWCAYPATARYSGQGERSQATRYICTSSQN